MAGSVDNHNMWLIISLVMVLSVSSILLQVQAVLLFQIWQQHQSNLNALKDVVTARNSSRAQYRRMKLRYVPFLVQKPRRINR